MAILIIDFHKFLRLFNKTAGASPRPTLSRYFPCIYRQIFSLHLSQVSHLLNKCIGLCPYPFLISPIRTSRILLSGCFFDRIFTAFFENLDRVSEKCYTESGNRIKISKVLFIFSANAKQEEFPIEDR